MPRLESEQPKRQNPDLQRGAEASRFKRPQSINFQLAPDKYQSRRFMMRNPNSGKGKRG